MDKCCGAVKGLTLLFWLTFFLQALRKYHTRTRLPGVHRLPAARRSTTCPMGDGGVSHDVCFLDVFGAKSSPMDRPVWGFAGGRDVGLCRGRAGFDLPPLHGVQAAHPE